MLSPLRFWYSFYLDCNYYLKLFGMYINLLSIVLSLNIPEDNCTKIVKYFSPAPFLKNYVDLIEHGGHDCKR